MPKNELTQMLYGGDYNPEQWPEESWDDDLKIFKNTQINSITINVFSWSLLQPCEEKYDFSKLDKIINKFSNAGFKIVLATATAAMPAWMFKKYPDVARVDYQGRRHVFGQRHNFCPSSPNYQRLAKQLVTQLTKRYADNEQITVWHINNEYGGYCYCNLCQQEFRKWLKNKYHSVNELNRAWNLNFWGHTIYHWDEIVVPNELGDAFGPENSDTAVSGLSIDYRRFQSDSLLKLFQMEKEIIEFHNDKVLVTTNFHGTPNPDLDYFKWAKFQDIIAYDSYPTYDTPAYQTAFLYDLMRGIGNGRPFMLMESTPSQVNWQNYSPLKRPGQLQAQELQAVAHGANTVQFFQLKQSVGAQEKFHGAVIAHSGKQNTRVINEVKQLGKTLQHVGPQLLQTTTQNKVAIIFDWSNLWAVNYAAGITKDLDYLASVLDYYRALYEMNIPVDIIGVDSDFSHYKLIIAPMLYMVKENLGSKITNFVENGGKFITSYFSGLVDETDNIYLGGYPGPLKKVTGLWVEETDAILPESVIKIKFNDGLSADGTLLSDLIHLERASALAYYDSEFYQGTPAITKNIFGKGESYYLGSKLDNKSLKHLFKTICQDQNDSLSITNYQYSSLELCKRVTAKTEYIFILNLSNQAEKIPTSIDLNKYETLLNTDKNSSNSIKAWNVMILKRNRLISD
ncbi:MAG: beta-galactosidase [Liquorilactobacillus ghanensis]|uniref:beta-galactosidase n=1 Tax=Liquorilactobacillus ghanensis TaxID=399370 RepID=UPI0039ED3D15